MAEGEKADRSPRVIALICRATFGQPATLVRDGARALRLRGP
jgi:hypothetical protein